MDFNTFYKDIDPVKRLMDWYGTTSKSEFNIDELLIRMPEAMLIRKYGENADISNLSKNDSAKNEIEIAPHIKSNLLLWPRTREMIAHLHLSFAEALHGMEEKDGIICDDISEGLSSMLQAGEQYEILGCTGLASSVFNRAYSFCEVLLSKDIYPLMQGMMLETMGVCKILLGRAGSLSLFKRSMKALGQEDNRLREREHNDSAWRHEGRHGIERLVYGIPILFAFRTNERLFMKKVQPELSMFEFLGDSYGYLSLERSKYFVEFARDYNERTRAKRSM